MCIAHLLGLLTSARGALAREKRATGTFFTLAMQAEFDSPIEIYTLIKKQAQSSLLVFSNGGGAENRTPVHTI